MKVFPVSSQTVARELCNELRKTGRYARTVSTVEGWVVFTA